MHKKKSSILMILFSVSGIVILTKIFGLIKQVIAANSFGATAQTDLISLSEGLVSNIDYLLVQALSTAFIPTYLHTKTTDNNSSKRFVSDTIKVFLIITFGIASIVFFCSPIIAKILAPSYSPELTLSLSKYIKILSPVLIFVTEMAVYNSLLKSNEKFIPGELIGFNQSLIFIVLVITVGNILGANTLIASFLCYAIFNLIFLSICSRGLWNIQRGNPFTNRDVIRLLKMMGPLLLGYSLVFVNQQVDKIIVSGLSTGTITAMGYAAVLSTFITTFVGSLCGVLFTYITKNIVDNEDSKAAQLTISSIFQLVTILLPISVLTIVNANDIVSIVFGRGKFDAVAVKNCSAALVGYAFMFVPFVIRELLSRFQYAYGDSKTPMINSSVAILFNIAFSILLSKIWGVFGVTFATSISVLICAVLNYLASHRRNHNLSINKAGSIYFRWIAGICVCIAVTLIGQKILSNYPSIVRFLLITFASFGIYCVLAFPVIKPMINMLRSK